MYFNKNNSFFHGIMFHHFHDDKIHLQNQGSLSQDDLYKLINFVGRNNILNADEFFHRYKENKLSKTDVCLTFDDALKCQYDIAAPVLEDINIKAFFFVYSSIFMVNPHMFEIHKYFRTNFYDHVDRFYDEFFKIIVNHHNMNLEKVYEDQKDQIEKIKEARSYYSYNDIKFRVIRDNVLTENEYNQIMTKMFEEKKFDYSSVTKNLFLSKNDLKRLQQNGHIVGLHSHSHPMKLENLDYDKQFDEYSKNLNIISEVANKEKIISMAHPCGSYNNTTLAVLEKLNIEIGFKINKRTDFKINTINNSKYELARISHSDIIRMIN